MTSKNQQGPSVLRHCWLGGRKGIRPVKNWVVGCWHFYLPGARCRFVYGPDDATVTSSYSSKSGLVLPFWYWLIWVVPDKMLLNGCCCCCCCCCCNALGHFFFHSDFTWRFCLTGKTQIYNLHFSWFVCLPGWLIWHAVFILFSVVGLWNYICLQYICLTAFFPGPG